MFRVYMQVTPGGELMPTEIQTEDLNFCLDSINEIAPMVERLTRGACFIITDVTHDAMIEDFDLYGVTCNHPMVYGSTTRGLTLAR